MSLLPSQSRIAFWKGISRQLDGHFGYHPARDENGPCRYIIEAIEDGIFTDLVDEDFVEDFFDAMRHVQQGTSINLYLPHEKLSLNRRFTFWWADIEESRAHERDYLTDDLRSTCLDTILRVDQYRLNHRQLKDDRTKLLNKLHAHTAHSPEWAARYVILRIYEALLVHVAFYHPATHRMVMSTFNKDYTGKKRTQAAEQAKREAAVTVRLWRQALGLMKPEAPATKPIGLRLIRGGLS